MSRLVGFKVSNRAYTLVELLVVLVISGILVVLALGAYDRYLTRAYREQAKVDLSRITAELASVRLQRVSDAQSTDAPEGEDPGVLAVFKQVSAVNTHYRFDWVLSATVSQGYKVRATPVAGGKQAGNGLLWLDNLGVGCWFEGEDSPDAWQQCPQGRYW